MTQSFACPDCVTQSFPACSKQGSGTSSSRCCVAQSFPCPDCVTQSFPLSRLCGTELPLVPIVWHRDSLPVQSRVPALPPAVVMRRSALLAPIVLHRASYVTQSFPCPDCVAQSFPACSKPGSGFFPGPFVTQSFPLSRLCGTELPCLFKAGFRHFLQPLLCSTELHLSRLCSTELCLH